MSGLSPRSADMLAARLLAAAAAPPSAKVLLPLAKDAAVKGQAAAMSVRQPATVRAGVLDNSVVRISASGPGAQVAARRALLHVEGRLMKVMDEVYGNTVRALGGKVR